MCLFFSFNSNFIAGIQESAEETNKKKEAKVDYQKDKKRQETRDWSNISNIKELKKSQYAIFMQISFHSQI